ncbi:nucleotidyltransferase domain-containing protein [Candidatus Pacearchaeota archaeon]|nr:nucleotidyltransferase domain-containing protein [Candidatus Pacearchaeota archaeon]
MFKKWTNTKNLEIVSLLRKDIFRGFPLSEIEKRLKFSHHPAYRRIKQLEKDKIVLKKEGNYRVNLKNPEAVEILYFISRREKLEFVNAYKNDLFKQLEKQFNENNDIEIAIIFGSYARKQETRASDLDIFIVSNRRKIDRSFELMYNAKSSVIYATKEEFVKMLVERKKIVKDIFTEGIVLKGNIYEILSSYYVEW